jgi:hypothetical protein
LLELNFHFPALTIRDFVERSESSYTLAGDYFNLTNSSIQNPVTISSSAGTIGGSIIVQDTTYFPTVDTCSPVVELFQYTGKTATSFTGCTVYKRSK